MAAGLYRAVLCSLIVLVAYTSGGYSCPELRECFPEHTNIYTCDENMGPSWTLEPSRTDCSMYLNCFNGIGLKSCCPDGMYFDPETKQCDEKALVQCNIEPHPCPDEPTVEPEEPTSTTADVTPATTDETETTTEDQSTETTTVGEESELDKLCASQLTDTFIEVAFPGDCNRYIACENRNLVSVETCPAALHFNPTKAVCDSPDHAECLDFLCQDNPDGQVLEKPSLNSCRLSYICVGNTTIMRECAPGTVFVPDNGWCVPDDNADSCEPERPPAPPVSVIVQCVGQDHDLGKIRHPEICAVYYRCINGRLYVRQCPPGLLFDIEREQCNLEESVSCNDEPRST